MNYIKNFFYNVDGSIKGIINPEELYRSIITALGSGSVVGVVILILQGVLTHVPQIIPNPSVASLLTVALTLILDLLRRQNQGATLAVTQVPVQAYNPVLVPTPVA